jgi:hypothetical protein
MLDPVNGRAADDVEEILAKTDLHKAPIEDGN